MTYERSVHRCQRSSDACSRPWEFAHFHYDFNNFTAILCQKHLDVWLDNADEDPSLESTSLEFVS